MWKADSVLVEIEAAIANARKKNIPDILVKHIADSFQVQTFIRTSLPQQHMR
jgi:hypothetical protein